MTNEILPDLLAPGLDLVVCGTAAGKRSATANEYYADPRNRFWKTLHESGLVPYRLVPGQFRELLQFGIGLTDLAKQFSGSDAGLAKDHCDVAGFQQRIERVRPRILAFNGKRAAREYFGFSNPNPAYGLQKRKVGTSTIFVASSTSGANGHWDPDSWHDLARLVRDL